MFKAGNREFTFKASKINKIMFWKAWSLLKVISLRGMLECVQPVLLYTSSILRRRNWSCCKMLLYENTVLTDTSIFMRDATCHYPHGKVMVFHSSCIHSVGWANSSCVIRKRRILKLEYFSMHIPNFTQAHTSHPQVCNTNHVHILINEDASLKYKLRNKKRCN